MKLLLEIEDQIAGIAAGMMVLAYTEKYFKISYSKILLEIALVIFFIFLILDIIYNFVDIGGQHIGWMFLAIVHSIVEIAIVVSMFSWITKINIPYTETIVPYFENPSVVLGVGYFFIIGSVLWLIFYFAFD